MNKKSILKAFGECYNQKDFKDISYLIREDVIYEAYDCLYKITSCGDVLKVLEESIKKNTKAYEGYFFYKGILTKRLYECVLICDENTIECVRIVHFKIRRGKVAYITGYNPKEYDFTRGKQIGD